MAGRQDQRDEPSQYKVPGPCGPEGGSEPTMLNHGIQSFLHGPVANATMPCLLSVAAQSLLLSQHHSSHGLPGFKQGSSLCWRVGPGPTLGRPAGRIVTDSVQMVTLNGYVLTSDFLQKMDSCVLCFLGRIDSATCAT